MFTTVAPYLTLTIPNGGEEWQRGLEHFIQWDDNLAEDVVLELYQGPSLVSILDTTVSTGAYLWEIPFNMSTGNDYFIKVKSVNEDTLSDFSDNAFTIMDTTTGITNNGQIMVQEYNLHQNYPNPFNPETNIEFEVKENCHVDLKIYDIQGRLVSTLINKSMSAGSYKVNFLANRLASGVYFYSIKMGDYKATKKMILNR
jgi:hypothetical protein